MAAEQKWPASDWQRVKRWEVARIPTLEERLNISKNEPGQYYQQTSASFSQAVGVLSKSNFTIHRALEIGAEADYYFLSWFRDRGAECHAVNVFFQFVNHDTQEWPERTLADMNCLPFREGVFDLVLLSATSHHSSDLDRTVREVARVLRPGGVALFLNDPIGGWLKRLGGPISHENRSELVHENEYSILKYYAAFRRHRFRVQYLFSDFYDRKLAGEALHPQMRFARLGKVLSGLWRIPAFRDVAKRHLLWAAHLVFGFPLNAIAWKPQRGVDDSARA
jgi:SAM-dependent methyltransferase